MNEKDWAVSEVLMESLRNAKAAPARFLTMTILVSCVLIAGILLDSLRLADIESSFASELRKGSTVVVVSASTDDAEDAISGRRCESLRTVPGIVEAGAVRLDSPVRLVTSPNIPVQSASATAGAILIWSPSIRIAERQIPATSGRVVVGSDLARELSLELNEAILIHDESTSLSVSGIIESTERVQRPGRWIIDEADPSGRFDECWIEFSPGQFSSGENSAVAWLTESSDVSLSTRRLIRDSDFARNYAAELRERPERLLWILSGGVTACLLWISTWSRRSEVALYRGLGMGLGRMTLFVMVEALIICIPSGLYAFVFSVSLLNILHALTLDQLDITLRSFSAAVAIPVTLSAIGLVPIMTRSTAELLKDRGA